VSFPVLHAHDYYVQRGGEDASFEAERRLLEDRGHRLATYVRHNTEIEESAVVRTPLPATLIWSSRAHRELRALLARERPAVAHFQNTFPLISPSAYDACRAEGVPVVQSLRNYRLICPSAILFRDGRVCEDCVGLRVPWPGVAHACYRQSRAQSAAVAAMLAVHNARRTWHDRVDLYVALTQFARRKLVEGGLPAGRIAVKPNFVVDPGGPSPVPERGAILYVGRLSPEKGVEDLMRAAARLHAVERVRIAGDGPDRPRLEAMGRAAFLGALRAEEVIEEMRRATVVVVPSRWYETFGRVVVEAFACGRPVVVARHGALAELVEEGRTGFGFAPGSADELAAALERAFADGVRMGPEARRAYEERYRPELNYRMMMGIYRLALERAGKRVPDSLRAFAPADPARSPFDWVRDA